MTAVETIELAQGSVDQLQRGIVIVGEQLDKADAFAQTATEVVQKTRRFSKRALICGLVLMVFGAAAVVIIKKRKQANHHEESTEILT